MTKTEFLNELRKKLRKLSDDEIENAINYYEEYFDDAGVENEEKVLREIGTPSNVAARIIGELAITQANKELKQTNKKDGISILMIIAAIFASPIALPIGVAIVTLVLVIALVIVVVYLAFMIAGIGVGVSGIVCFIASFILLFKSAANALALFGIGLFAMAAGVAICYGNIILIKKTFYGIKKILGKLLVKGAKK